MLQSKYTRIIHFEKENTATLICEIHHITKMKTKQISPATSNSNSTHLRVKVDKFTISNLNFRVLNPIYVHYT